MAASSFFRKCPAKSLSPDGRFNLIQTAYVQEADVRYEVYIADQSGSKIGRVPNLNDEMPFVLIWSPRSGWFMINHYQGSGLERPRIFEIKGPTVIEHVAFLQKAQQAARAISPCLPASKDLWITGRGMRWSKDGRKIAWAFYTRPDACMKPDQAGPVLPSQYWSSFLMISDVENGEVDPRSIRIYDDGKIPDPRDGPYAAFDLTIANGVDPSGD